MRRAGRLKRALLVLAALTTIGTWGNYNGTIVSPAQAQNQPRPQVLPDIPPALDHYLCYAVQEIKNDNGSKQENQTNPASPSNREHQSKRVELWNQQGVTFVRLGEAKLLCMPTLMHVCDSDECPQLHQQ